MSRTRSISRVAALSAALTLAAAVIPATASGQGSVRGFDGTTIKIAGIAVKSNFAKSDIGAQARFKRFNDTDELKGVKIDYVEYADTTQDPAVGLSEVRRLVTQVGVFAIVPDLSAVNPGDYMNQQHLPYFGYGFDDTYCSPKPSTKLYGFSYTGCTIATNPPYVADAWAGMYQYVSKQSGNKKPTALIVSQDNQAGKNSLNRNVAQAKGAGFKVVYAKATLPEQVSDYTPYVQEWMKANNGKPPDHFQCSAVTQCLGMWDAVKAAGYKGTFWTGLYSDALVKALGGTISWGFYNQQPSAALTQFEKDVAAVAPAGTKAQDNWIATSYFAADMFIQALKTAAKKGTSNITPENVQKAASTMTWQIKGSDGKKLVGPMTYPDATVVPTPSCNSLVGDPDGVAWQTVLPYSCSTKRIKVSSSG
jgi:ABC-type branched-subunit amino acid transport system substrate-binding protein